MRAGDTAGEIGSFTGYQAPWSGWVVPVVRYVELGINLYMCLLYMCVQTTCTIN